MTKEEFIAGLNSLKKAELKYLCDAGNIKYTSSDTVEKLKAKLIDAFPEEDEEAAEAKPEKGAEPKNEPRKEEAEEPKPETAAKPEKAPEKEPKQKPRQKKEKKPRQKAAPGTKRAAAEKRREERARNVKNINKAIAEASVDENISAKGTGDDMDLRPRVDRTAPQSFSVTGTKAVFSSQDDEDDFDLTESFNNLQCFTRASSSSRSKTGTRG